VRSPAESFSSARIPASAGGRTTGCAGPAEPARPGRQPGCPGELGQFSAAETPPGPADHPQHRWEIAGTDRRGSAGRPARQQGPAGHKHQHATLRPRAAGDGASAAATDHGKPAGEVASIGRPYQRCFSAPPAAETMRLDQFSNGKGSWPQAAEAKFRVANEGEGGGFPPPQVNGTWSCAGASSPRATG